MKPIMIAIDKAKDEDLSEVEFTEHANSVIISDSDFLQ